MRPVSLILAQLTNPVQVWCMASFFTRGMLFACICKTGRFINLEIQEDSSLSFMLVIQIGRHERRLGENFCPLTFNVLNVTHVNARGSASIEDVKRGKRKEQSI